MLTHKNTVTAILAMAVIFVSVLVSGCATTRHVREIRADIARVEAQNSRTQDKIDRMDSVIVAGADADSRLRADMSSTVEQLSQQIAMLLENYNDLMVKMDQLVQKPEMHILNPSPGASDPTAIVQQEPVETPAEQSKDCTLAYDSAFILVVGGEYEQAIKGFREFLTNCPEHDNVESAYYWIGECHWSLEKYADAIIDLEYLINEFKGSPNIGRALYKLARSKQELDQTDEAKALFQRLIDDYPGGLEAEQAKERLKELK